MGRSEFHVLHYILQKKRSLKPGLENTMGTLHHKKLLMIKKWFAEFRSKCPSEVGTSETIENIQDLVGPSEIESLRDCVSHR